MAIRRAVAFAMAFAMALGAAPTLAQQTNGLISGRAGNEAREPYSDYSVQLRDAVTGQVVNSVPLNPSAQFTFPSVGFDQRLLVELVQLKQNRTVCTEGPYVLTAGSPTKTDVNIDCGKVPAAFWILTAGAGTAAAIAFAVQSTAE